MVELLDLRHLGHQFPDRRVLVLRWLGMKAKVPGPRGPRDPGWGRQRQLRRHVYNSTRPSRLTAALALKMQEAVFGFGPLTDLISGSWLAAWIRHWTINYASLPINVLKPMMITQRDKVRSHSRCTIWNVTLIMLTVDNPYLYSLGSRNSGVLP